MTFMVSNQNPSKGAPANDSASFTCKKSINATEGTKSRVSASRKLLKVKNGQPKESGRLASGLESSNDDWSTFDRYWLWHLYYVCPGSRVSAFKISKIFDVSWTP